MASIRTVIAVIAMLVIAMPLLSCSGKRPPLGITDSRLTPCPSSPNCVSSDAEDDLHKVVPLLLGASAEATWQAARDLVSRLPRTEIVAETPDYLHAECRSAVFGFVDDLELNLRVAEGVIAVRSASRLGYSDFGVNRRRVEALRAGLAEQVGIR